VTDRAELTSRTIGDIDLTGATPRFTVELDRQVALADVPAEVEKLDTTAARLARIERLLEADLAALGPSVVTASIGEITARLDSLSAEVDAVGGRWERAEERLAGQLGARVEQRLDAIDARVDRLTRLVEAATEPEPEGTTSPTEVALHGVQARIDALITEVARLAAIADRVEARD
jgi:outer membrane murein-binding lipoprotein Lpp